MSYTTCLDGRTNVLRPHVVLDANRNEVCACETEEQAARVVAAFDVVGYVTRLPTDQDASPEQCCAVARAMEAAPSRRLRLVNWWNTGGFARVLVSIDYLDDAEILVFTVPLTRPKDASACIAEVEAAVRQKAEQLKIPVEI